MDISRQHRPLKEEMIKTFERILDTSDFVMGPALRTFEEHFMQHMGTTHAIGVASGTDALLLSLQAVGVGPGDEVICPAFTFAATAEVIYRLGATIVFVDINDEFLVDPENVRAAITERTKAIVPVHLFGMACQIDTLAQIAADFGLYLIEDVAQATGAVWGERYLGTYGIAGCFSFYPTKNLAALGDGGLILTSSDELAERVRLLRDHGRQNGQFLTLGYNSRLDSLQASMLDLKLESLREDNADRLANATFYEENLSREFFTLPAYRTDGSHVYNQYTIRHPNRDELRHFLAERQIETRVYYPTPLHLEPCFEMLGYREGHFPHAEQAARQVLALPIYPGLTKHELKEVVHTLELYAKTHPVPLAS